MTGPTTWRTDDPCLLCHTGLILTDDADGNPGRQDCPLCGWSLNWQAALDLDDSVHQDGGIW